MNWTFVLVGALIFVVACIVAWYLIWYRPTPPPSKGCKADADCPVGQSCKNGGCVPVQKGCENDAQCPQDQKCIDGTCQFDDTTSGQVADFRITNRTKETLWIEARQGALGKPLPGYTSPIVLPANQSLDFNIPAEGLVGTRFWAKVGCDSQGKNCAIGDQVQYIGGGCPPGGCQPPVDSLFEATFGCVPGTNCAINPADGTKLGPITYFDTSHVDGYTLPYKLYIKGDVKGKCSRQCCPDEPCKPVISVIDGSQLDLRKCPTDDDLSVNGQFPTATDNTLSPPRTYSLKSVDLRVFDPSGENILGCMSPCKKLNYGQPIGFHQDEAIKPTLLYCCPTPSKPGQPVNEDTCKESEGCMTSARCRTGPVVDSKYVKAIHEMAPDCYAYSYDDCRGLESCTRDVKYELVFGPRGSVEYPVAVS
jgi:hypothetical protein